MKLSATDLDLVEEFLAELKFLNGPMPEFGPTNFNRRRRYELATKWPLADADGVVSSGQLVIVSRPGSPDFASLSLLFRGQAISRLDFEHDGVCHSNPHWADEDGLAATVRGSHFHPWEPNRKHVAATGLWELPCREGLPPQVRRFQQGFYWMCDRVNITVSPDQRSFDIPPALA